MSLTFIRSLVLAGALGAALLGAGLAHADDGDAPADAPADVGAATPADGYTDYYDSGTDLAYVDPAAMAKSSLERALTTVMSGCRTGLLATKVTVIKNEVDPSSGYILVSEITEFGRSTQEKLSMSSIESCVMAMDASMIDKETLDAALETISIQMEALLAMP